MCLGENAHPVAWIVINHYSSTRKVQKFSGCHSRPCKVLRKKGLCGNRGFESSRIFRVNSSVLRSIALSDRRNASPQEHNLVGAAREVKVAAGTFQAVHLDTKVTQGNAKVLKSYDYADGVGLVRSHTETGGVKSDCKLIDYSFKTK